jgi:hypothetical protein
MTMGTSNSPSAASDSAARTMGMVPLALKPDERGASIDQRQHPDPLRGDLFGRPR